LAEYKMVKILVWLRRECLLYLKLL
jgi:hypothetical protein